MTAKTAPTDSAMTLGTSTMLRPNLSWAKADRSAVASVSRMSATNAVTWSAPLPVTVVVMSIVARSLVYVVPETVPPVDAVAREAVPWLASYALADSISTWSSR